MSDHNYLVLLPTKQALEDFLSSPIPLSESRIVIPHHLENFLTEEAKPYTFIPENYEETTHLIHYHDEFPYTWVIAPEEIDILRAAQIRSIFHLPGQNIESATAFRQKSHMKDILNKTKIPLHSYTRIKNTQEIENFIEIHGFPIVIKPDLGTASEGIYILRTQEELNSYIDKHQDDQFNDIQIEEYLEGVMYNINGFWGRGEMICVWPSVYPSQSIEMLTGKPASSYTLSASNPLVPVLNNYARMILKALPTPDYSPFHLEVFVQANGKIGFCEIACRIGGKGVRQSWEETFGISLSNLYYEGILTQTNSSDEIKPLTELHPKILSGEIWFPTRLGQLTDLPLECPFPWVKDYQTFYKPGDEILQDSESINDCLCGIQLFVGETEQEIQERLNQLTLWIHEKTKWEEQTPSHSL